MTDRRRKLEDEGEQHHGYTATQYHTITAKQFLRSVAVFQISEFFKSSEI
jgi:hypothetical protein